MPPTQFNIANVAEESTASLTWSHRFFCRMKKTTRLPFDENFFGWCAKPRWLNQRGKDFHANR